MDIIELETKLDHLEIARAKTETDAALRFGVLLAEDSEEDHVVAMRALNKSLCLRPVAEVFDGKEVVDYLSGEGKYGNRASFPFPALLLLDVQMPRMDGFEVLA